MKPHIKIFHDFNNVTPGEWIPCNICEASTQDIHHIECRGMGGDPTGETDHPFNLQPVCRECHDLYGDKEKFKPFLFKKNMDRIFRDNQKKALTEISKMKPSHKIYKYVLEALGE